MKKLIPLLFLYILAVLIFHNRNFIGDEVRYIMFADNLARGFYSPVDSVHLGNGPGYPLILVPFVLLKTPWVAAKLFNAILLFMSICYFYKTIQLYIKENIALLCSYFLGLYPPLFIYIPLLMTEIVSFFLICGFLFYFCRLYNDDSKRIYLFASSAYLAYLALTKIFFGYVIAAGIVIFSVLYLYIRKDAYRKAVSVYLIALFMCLPYLFYTYSLTNKIYYWGGPGGSNLYWMSTPVENEYGDWFDLKKIHKDPGFQNHQEDFNKFNNLSSIQLDDEMKQQAISNIIQNPLKYFKNITANIGRMLFNYPYSYTPQKMTTYFYIVSNIFIVAFSILCIYPYLSRRKMIPKEIHLLMVFLLISFGGSSLLSAYPRQFMILVPILILWIAFILTRILKIEFRTEKPCR